MAVLQIARAAGGGWARTCGNHGPRDAGKAGAVAWGVRRAGAGSPHLMVDALFTLGTVAFFALALGFAAWLDRLDSKETP